MDLQLTGRRAVITGGSRGIGLAVARALVAEGADVALVARDQSRLRDAAAGLAGLGGGRIVTAVCDTGDDAAVTAMAADVRSQLGGVEILVNSAALVNTGPMSDEMLDEQLNVKLKGYLRCARAFAPGMIAERLGPDHQHLGNGGPADRFGGRLGPQRRGVRDDQEPRRRVRARRAST